MLCPPPPSPPALQVRPISAHWNAPNEAAAQTDKHVDRGLVGGGVLSLPLVNRPHPHPLPFFFSCPALCLFGSVHPRSLSWGTYQPEEEERRGGGGAGSSVSSSGEERRGEKGGEREQTAWSAGHQREEGSLCFSSPPPSSRILLFIAVRQTGGVKVAAGRETPRGRTLHRDGGVRSGGGGGRGGFPLSYPVREIPPKHTPLPPPPPPSCHPPKAPPLPPMRPPPSLPLSLRRPLSPALSSSAEEDGDAVAPADGLLALSLDSARRGCPSSGWRKSCFKKIKKNSRGWRRAGCCRVKEGKLQVPLSSCSARREPKCWNFDEESEKTGL